MEILVTLPVQEKHKKQLEASAPSHQFHYKAAKNLTADDLLDISVIIGNPPANLLAKASQLQWVQLNSAGADPYCQAGILPTGVRLTNATGAYGLALSEYMLAALLAMQKKLYAYHDNQKQELWQDEGSVTSIYGAKVLVIGLGDIGGNFASRVKALGAHVTGIRRRPSACPAYVDEIAGMDALDTCLSQADIVASILPGTSATHHLFDAAAFAKMKQGAYFINAGRGNTVVTDALCNALRSGHLAGAAVDVTDPEPLPSGHPMWSVPNLHITPHTAGQYHLAATLDFIVQIAAQNMTAFLQNKPLKNEVDFSTGYKK